MSRVLTVLLALALAATPAAAQFAPGDYVAPVNTLTGTNLLGITPGGVVTTVHALPFAVTALAMAANNMDLAVLGSASRTAFLALITPAGKITTLTTLPLSPQFENLAVDQNGTYLTPPMGLAGAWIFRIDGGGGVTTILPTPNVGGGKTRGIAVDIGSGDYLVGESSSLFRIAFSGQATVASRNINIPNETDMVSDARSGGLINWKIDPSSLPVKYALVSIDPGTGAATTIRTRFGNVSPGLAYDRARDAFVLAEPSPQNALVRVNRSGGATTVAALAGARDLEVYGSRNVLAGADPTPGSAFGLAFSEPGSPNHLYLAAASFGHGPGIPTPAGVVDLALDPLFILSQAAPAVFVNFQGLLDANGSALALVLIPAGPLKGLRFYVSFVTIQGGAIRAVANTQGFTIR